CMQGLEVPWTF
nr:immunoglobulin light chain junction region [Macaca mulatta]